MTKRICAVSGSRADWGLLSPVLREIKADSEHFKLQLIVTGSHLDQDHGHTVEQILADGFEVDYPIALDLADDSPLGVTLAISEAVAGFAKALDKLRPDLLLILGDRYEIFAAAQAALIARIPVAHIAGGDITEGAFDDAIRHAISKLSHIHFVTNQDAEKRLEQMGENPLHIHLCGSPGIDNILATPLLAKNELEKLLDFELLERNIAITFHSTTLDKHDGETQVRPLLAALEQFDDVGLIFTAANADPDGIAINEAIQAFVDNNRNARFYKSLGAQGYYSLARHSDIVLGNSSSGLYEAATLETISIDIGKRQQGRLRGNSVIHCDSDAIKIANAIEMAFLSEQEDFDNPYGKGMAAKHIVERLRAYPGFERLVFKSFHEMN